MFFTGIIKRRRWLVEGGLNEFTANDSPLSTLPANVFSGGILVSS
jgi:hypothetical protein